MSLALREARIPDSSLARWDGRWRLAALGLAMLGFSAIGTPAPALVAVALALLLALLSRIPLSDLFSGLSILLLGLIPVWLVVPFTSETGTQTAIMLSLRLLAIGTLGIVMMRTAPLPDLLSAAHQLFIPGILIQIAQLAYRYAFLFFDESRRLRIALRVRGFQVRTSTHTYRTTGHTVGTLLVRGGERAERVADAMRCRGFDGHFHSLKQFRTSTMDVLAFLALVGVTVALICWDELA